MKYTVVWRPAALDALAQMWTEASDREEVNRASHEIDQALAHRPHAVGESRGDGVRVLFSDPLGVFYEVRDEDRLVSVTALWRRS